MIKYCKVQVQNKMEQKDYLLREIEKLTQLLIVLTNKVSGLNSVNFEIGIKQINAELITQFDLSLDILKSIDKAELIERIKNIDKANIELFVELLSKIIEKISELKKEKEYSTNELASKGVMLIEFLDKTTEIFSIERMNLKTKLLSGKS